MRNQKGITLLMLVLTIIVLLVLAAISINIALGDNGIFRNANNAKIMSKVEVLDDTIKAYTLKSSDPYSSSKKTIDDLINEGILTKITITDGATEETDKKTIYYVNFENEEVAKRLGLDKSAYQNLTKLNKFEYNSLEELQDKGIYVVDNDLNAAYLKNNRTYGKLVNFGNFKDINGDLEFASQNLTLRINPGEVPKEQEVIIVLDITASMSLTMSGKNSSGNQSIPYSSLGIEKGYDLTRWAATVKALDAFIDTYFENSENQKNQ